MLALTCLLLFGLAAAAALTTMIVAVRTNSRDLATLRLSYRSAPQAMTVSWRIATDWSQLRGASRPDHAPEWSSVPQKLAA